VRSCWEERFRQPINRHRNQAARGERAICSNSGNDAATINHANQPLPVTAYGQILGIPATNLVWTYLNKGTHETANRDDFDDTPVETIVQTLEALDGLDLRVGR
jgi:hypothetical protein